MQGLAALLLLVAIGVAGCDDEPTPRALSAELSASGAPGPPLDPDLELGPFLSRHWRLPVPEQGPVPDGFSEAEASLDPAICGACHPLQYTQWQTSLHAGAYSPGFAGQLIEGGLAQPLALRGCQTCHAPLEEQQPYDAALAANPGLDPALRARGIVCAACHVRAHRTFGPPRRADLAPLVEPVPHAGFQERREYLESRFCAECHQFFDDAGVEGKPIENTYAEWRQSPQAAAGRHCQDCHMPDRAHLWRGIHDPDMVRSAIDVELVAADLAGETLQASLVLRNRDVGHAFPTYVTPRVFLSVAQVDAAGDEIADTRAEGTVGREVDFSSNTEVFDTRVLPGESVRVDYAVVRALAAEALVGRVVVDPDFHYRGVFDLLLGTLSDAQARAQIADARKRTSESSYVLTEIRHPLPRRAP